MQNQGLLCLIDPCSRLDNTTDNLLDVSSSRLNVTGNATNTWMTCQLKEISVYHLKKSAFDISLFPNKLTMTSLPFL